MKITPICRTLLNATGFIEKPYRPWPVDGEFYVSNVCAGILDLCVKVNDKMIYLASVKCLK